MRHVSRLGPKLLCREGISTDEAQPLRTVQIFSCTVVKWSPGIYFSPKYWYVYSSSFLFFFFYRYTHTLFHSLQLYNCTVGCIYGRRRRSSRSRSSSKRRRRISSRSSSRSSSSCSVGGFPFFSLPFSFLSYYRGGDELY